MRKRFEMFLGSCRELCDSKEFWKDAGIFLLLAAVLYLVYVVVEYWPEITEGFNKGWNSR